MANRDEGSRCSECNGHEQVDEDGHVGWRRWRSKSLLGEPLKRRTQKGSRAAYQRSQEGRCAGREKVIVHSERWTLGVFRVPVSKVFLAGTCAVLFVLASAACSGDKVSPTS